VHVRGWVCVQDIHPPLAKLVFAIVLILRGFVGAEEERVVWWAPKQFIGTKDWLLLYDQAYGLEYITLRKVGQWAGGPRAEVRWRPCALPDDVGCTAPCGPCGPSCTGCHAQVSALVGSALVVMAFLSARAAGCGRVAGVLCAWLVGVESLILLQSRLILCDVFLYFFNVATMAASFASVRAGLNGKQQLLWCAVTGLSLGCCLSVKLTALGLLATVGVHQLLCLSVSATSLHDFLHRGLTRAGACRRTQPAVCNRFVWGRRACGACRVRPPALGAPCARAASLRCSLAHCPVPCPPCPVHGAQESSFH
jgi:hypothetical protein